MDESHFPLRWESTGDQWWYASPIDWAAANGHYNVVRELLHLDANLLIKLTSLRRIHRLESVWDDDMRFVDAARNRSFIARCLLLDCESCGRTNRLVCAGYGGWLLYTASSAGDAGFVQELLERQPLLVFGEGEYGVTDILYAAARSRSSEVFRLLLDSVLSPRCLTGEARGEILEELRNEGSCGSGPNSMFRLEMMNRAMHAAARGGNLEVLRELLKGCSDASAYRDAQGSTILHTASAKGQVEVVKDLIASFNIVNSTDDQGNTALHIAAFRGHLPVIEALVTASLSLISVTNEVGDTLLHMALTGFRTPGFRRLDHQMELMKKLIGGVIMDIHDIINARNDDGRTVLHLAVVGNVHSDLVELLMTAPSIDLNVHDNDGMTPLDLLRKQPRSASSEILIKQLILAGGISNLKDHEMRSAIASQLKMQCIVGSPGTAFRISDAEIFLHAGIDASGISERTSSFSSAGRNPVQNVTKHLKILLKWPRHKGKSAGGLKELQNDDSSLDSVNSGSKVETPTPLRQRYSKVGSMFNNKQTLATKSSTPSPATKKKFTVGLMHGVIQTMPHLLPPSESPSLSVSRSSPSLADKIEGIHLGNDQPSPSKSGFNSNTPPKKYGSLNSRLMNQYFCLGAQGLTVEDSTTEQRSNRMIKRSLLSVA